MLGLGALDRHVSVTSAALRLAAHSGQSGGADPWTAFMCDGSTSRGLEVCAASSHGRDALITERFGVGEARFLCTCDDHSWAVTGSRRPSTTKTRGSQEADFGTSYTPVAELERATACHSRDVSFANSAYNVAPLSIDCAITLARAHSRLPECALRRLRCHSGSYRSVRCHAIEDAALGASFNGARAADP